MTPPAANATLSARDEQFLSQIALIDAEVVRNEAILKEALSLAQATRDELLGALAEASMRRTLEFMVQATQQLRPQHLRTDQDAYVQYLGASIGFGRRYDQAVEQGDLLAASINTTAIFLTRARMLIGASPVFCERAFVAESKALCGNAEPPGGAYGAELRPIFRKLSSEFLPSTEFLPSQYSPEEAALAFASILHPKLIAMVRGAFDSMQELEPPSHLRLDHARITRYLADTLDAALAMGATAENQDTSATEVDLGAFARLRNDAADDLSTEAKTIVAPYFP